MGAVCFRCRLFNNKKTPCQQCKEIDCPTCNGYGAITKKLHKEIMPGVTHITTNCLRCHGTGKIMVEKEDADKIKGGTNLANC